MIGILEDLMGSLGLPEIAFIFVLALLIFGPKKLPELGRTLGQGMAEFRRATNELKRSINTELALDENPAPPQLRPRRLEDPWRRAPRAAGRGEASRRGAGMTEPRSAGVPPDPSPTRPPAARSPSSPEPR